MLRAGTLILLLTALPLAAAGPEDLPSLPEVAQQGFEVVTLEGDTVPLADLLQEGRPVVVEFWATWCAPCRKSFPHLAKMKDKYGARLVVLALTVEDPRADLTKVERFSQEYHAGFRIAFAPQELYRAMTHRSDVAVPKLFVFDADGALVTYIPRYSPLTSHKLRSAVARVMAGRETT